MAQMFPDEDDRKRAQDSIDHRLRTYGKDLWVPTREEYLAMKEMEAAEAKAKAAGDSIPERTVVEASDMDSDSAAAVRTKKRTSSKKTAKTKKPSTKKPKVSSSSSNSGAAKSVRRRRR